MTTYKRLIKLLALTLLLLSAPMAEGQVTTLMQNHDTVYVSACQYGNGVIYDDGGLAGDYSNNFEGWVAIESSPGISIRLTGSIDIENSYDQLTITDGATTLYGPTGGTATLDISSTTGIMILYFRSDYSGSTAGLALQWTVEGVGTICSNTVSALTATNITRTSTSLQWTADNTAGPFAIEYNRRTVSGITGGNYTLTGLSAGCPYDITVIPTASVQSRCCADYVWVRAACGTATLPVEETFEGLIEGGFHPCWLLKDNFDDEATEPQIVAAQRRSGERSMMISCGPNDAEGHKAVIATQPFVHNGSCYVTLSLMASHSGTVLVIGSCDTTSSESSYYGFTPLTTLTINNQGTWEDYRIQWTPPTSGCRLAFMMEQSMQSGIGRRVYIDNLGIAACGVENLAVEQIEETSMVLTWDTYGSPSCNVGVRHAGGLLDEQTFTNATSPLTINGLTAGTRYELIVYPNCGGTTGIPRTIVASTATAGVPADGFCTDFGTYINSNELPADWTFLTFGESNLYRDGEYIRSYVYNVWPYNHNTAFMISPRISGLAGKTVAVRHHSTYNNGQIIVGTTYYPTDTSTFVPADTINTISFGWERYDSTVLVQIPTSDTGRYLALKFSSQQTYSDNYFFIQGIHIDSPHIGDDHVLHHRGTSMVIDLGAAHDTAIVQYEYENMAIGSFGVDTFYNTQRVTINNLDPIHWYRFHCHLPGHAPCPDFNIHEYTIGRDYPLPYCENFKTIPNLDEWNYGWYTLTGTSNRPRILQNFNVDYYHQGDALDLASWGFNWSYYSQLSMPDVELDSVQTYLSLYMRSTAPQSILEVGRIKQRHNQQGEFFEVIDTIDIPQANTRHHYTLPIPNTQEMRDSRLAMRYTHSNQYTLYDLYIDEISIAHSTYGNMTTPYVGYDTVVINIDTLIGADSLELMLVGDSTTYRIGAADIHSICIGGLDTGSLYKVFVRPLDEGCFSYAGHFWTHNIVCTGNYCYYNCFDFDNLMSYELPPDWAASTGTTVNAEDHLEVPAGGALSWNPQPSVNNPTLNLRARSSVHNDTLLIGYLHEDSIARGNNVFAASLKSDVIITDTIVIDTVWQHFAKYLNITGVDSTRVCFLAGNGTLQLDNMGISGCPIMNIAVDGNCLVCTMDDNRSASYMVYLVDSAGTDERELYITEFPYRIQGLQLGSPYHVAYSCINHDTVCMMHLTLRTTDTVPLPYCENFENTETIGGVPPTWKHVTSGTSTLGMDMWGPSVSIPAVYNKWSYTIMPSFDADSALMVSIHMYNYGTCEIGALMNGTDTSTFVPIHRFNHDWVDEDVDLSAYSNKRIAIRLRGSSANIFRISFYGIPAIHCALINSTTLEITTPVNHNYYIKRNDWGTNYQDSIMLVTENPYYLQVPENNNDINIVTTQDSSGYTCDNNKYYQLNERYNLPYCKRDYWWEWAIRWHCGTQHCPGNRSFTEGYYYENNVAYFNSCYHTGNVEYMLLPDFDIDSIRRLSISFSLQSDYIGDTLEIGVMYDAYDTNTYVPVDTVVYTNAVFDWQRFGVSMSRYTGRGRWIAFRHRSGQCPTCSETTYLNFNEIEVTACPASSATATLSRWNRVKIDVDLRDTADFVPFLVEYGPSGFSQGWGTLTRIDSLPTILELSPETAYDFYFRCDSNTHSCALPQKVKTLNSPISVPSCIDFDTVTTGTMPRFWNSFNTAICVTDTIAHSASKSLVLPIGLRSYAATPDINTDSLQDVALSLWFRAEDLSDRLVIGTMDNPYDLSTFHPLRTLAPKQANTWQRELIEFSNAPSGHHFIALRARSTRTNSSRNIYVDDIYVSNCGAFNMRVQNVEFNAITLDWSQVGDPNISISVIEDNTVTNTIAPTTHPVTISPLNTHSRYTFRFNSVCDGNTGYCTTDFLDSVTLVTPKEGTGCVNPTDLYSSQATFFSGTYNNPYSTAGAVDFGSSHPESRHTVCYDTTERDPHTGNQLRTIPEGYTSSVRLGNWSTNSVTPEAEGVIYSLFVDTSSFQLLMMNYAAVLQDPQHARSDQPRFRLELLDSTFHLIDSACTSADFIADQSLGWHTADDGVLWKDWTSVGIDISAHANEQVYVRLTTFDCNEGSHYGYAYFTLECREKQIETTSCGDVITNTLTAPAGFVYRWYKSTSPTTVGTTQSIVIPSEDVTYYCDLSFIDNPACTFTLSAYGGTRYPMASFDTAMYIDSCRFYMTFTNTSAISNDHVNNLPGTTCENAYWDFGNGQTSTNYHASTKYLLPGTYTVMLVSSIADGECSDTAYMTFNLILPLELMPSDTLVSSICDNQTQLFYDTNYNQPGTYYHITPTGDFCDSLNVLQLDVRLTSNSDTTAIACDSIRWRGALYTASGVYVSGAIGLNAANCDSTRTLHLTVNPTYDTVDTIIVCPWRPYMYRDIDFGGPATFDTALLTIKDCDSVVHVVIRPRDTTFHIAAYHTFGSNVHWKAVDSIIFGCAPDTLHLVDSTANAFNRLWEFYIQDTVAYADSNVTRFDWVFQHSSDSLAAVAVLKVESEGHCWDTAAWPIVMLKRPYAQFEWAPTNPPLHDPEARFINLTYEPEPLRYLWNIQEVVGGAFDTSTAREPSYHWGQPGDDVTGDYVIKLCAYWDHVLDTLLHGDWYDSSVSIYHYLLPTLQFPITHTCLDSTDNVITITNDFLQFPNLVTPNGDGNNDIWKVVNLVEFGEYSMNELWIFDRWGVLIYHVKNISTDADFWDPNATNSPDGTYYYRFQARSLFGLVKRNGLIEVLRN